MHEELIELALVSADATYLEREQQLRAAGADALPALAAYLDDADPVARLFARTLTAWIRGDTPQNDAALAYLEELPVRTAPTPLGEPRAVFVPDYLGSHFGPAVTNLIALRVLKVPSLPDWYAVGALLYLAAQRDPSTTEALIRYLSQTRSPRRRKFAADALRAIDDPDLASKVEAERTRLDARLRELL